MSATKTIMNLYNPGEKRKDDLIAEFVIRLREFENIFADIKSSKMEHSEQPYLIVGQRGSGKTTLIHRLRYAIEDDPELNPWLIPIAFNEEQYNITELGDLWLRIAEYLEDYHDMPGIVGEMNKQYGTKNPESKQFEVLERYLNEHKKKIIIFIDNLGDLLKKFEEIEVRRLRKVLQTSADLRMIAASPIMLDDLEDYRKALFEFFKTVRLGGLGKGDMQTLLRALGDKNSTREQIEKIITEAPERIEIMRRLTGGITRTVVMMYNIFVENAEGNPYADLQKLLDEATPLYKHKMDDLPKQQQKIVDAVAKKWDAVTSGELAEVLRTDSKVISAQLRQLEKDQWIEKIETNTKNHLYELQERFFNIWYLMRNGRKYERERVMYFVKFMEALLEKEEIERRIETMLNKHWKGQIDLPLLSFWTEIYIECDNISPIYKTLLLTEQLKIDHPTKEQNILTKKLDDSYAEIIERPDKFNDYQIDIILKNFFKDEKTVYSLFFEKRFRKNEIADRWSPILRKKANEDKTGFTDMFLMHLLFNNSDIKESTTVINNALAKFNVLALGILLYVTPLNDDISTFLNELLQKTDDGQKHYKLYKCFTALLILFNNEIENSWKILGEILNESDSLIIAGLNLFFSFEQYLHLLIAKYQYQYAYQLVMNEKLKMYETDRPLYYALMHYMRAEHPNEYLRMPPEMKETTEDIIKKIEAFRAKDEQQKSAD
jgi:DNA-binding MarR family transcriptional regulator